MILAITLVLAATSAVAHSQICCPPSRFNTFQDITFSNSSTVMRALYYFAYDGPNQRYFIGEDRIASNFYGTKKTIYDYKKRTAYRIDSVARTCTTFPTEGRFLDKENICVPGDAETLGPLFYGFGTDTLHSTTYTFNSTTSDGRHQNVYAVVSQKDCIPIISTTFGTDSAGGKSLYVLAYNNFFPGIRDVSIFAIPSYC